MVIIYVIRVRSKWSWSRERLSIKEGGFRSFFFNLSYIFVDGFETYYKVKMKVNFVKVFYWRNYATITRG